MGLTTDEHDDKPEPTCDNRQRQGGGTREHEPYAQAAWAVTVAQTPEERAIDEQGGVAGQHIHQRQATHE